MLRTFLSLCLAFLLAGCADPCHVCKTSVEAPVCVSKPRPKMALMVMKDSSDCAVPWDMSAELTQAFRAYAQQCSKLCWQTEKNAGLSTWDSCSMNPFGNDLFFTKKLCHSDFLVALELLEHDVVPYADQALSPAFPAEAQWCSSVLAMKVRLRIIDLRFECPRILKQEIICSNYLIPREAERVDYFKMHWGKELFPTTPWGIAHERLVHKLVHTVEASIKRQCG